jgi:hypothetical protein
MFKTFATITLLGVATISGVFAQSAQPLKADVPFAFTVQDTNLPAGHYQFTYSNTAHVLSIRGLDRNQGAGFVTAEPIRASNSSEQARLTFHCYDKTCYLAQAWQGSTAGLKVLQPERERRLVVAARVIAVTIPAR